MLSQGRKTVSLDDILRVTTESQIVYHYLGITKIPCRIHSPLRRDKKPSFGLFSPDGKRITYIDFSTKDSGTLLDLLGKMWNTSFNDTLERIYSDFSKFKGQANLSLPSHCPVEVSSGNDNVSMECRIRDWREHDIEYWKSYGITLPWLKYANVYPISHKIIIKNGRRLVFGADRYAYAFVEFKEGKTTLKIYQPYNTQGFKWSNKHDRSVISLWTKVPEKGDRICICSSLKDALCLWENTGIPALAIQGEGYGISETAVRQLYSRFSNVYILLDNDDVGISDARKLAEETGFTNIVLPKINGAKDISDLYLSLKDKSQFSKIILNLFL